MRIAVCLAQSERILIMKVVLFCGGLGTRIREYSESIPKPMIPVGHQPILGHIMHYYSQYGHRDFVLCLGYKANVIKDHFLNLNRWTNSNLVVSNYGKDVKVLGEQPPDWKVTLSIPESGAISVNDSSRSVIWSNTRRSFWPTTATVFATFPSPT